jgi:hypothetical protein
MYAAAIPPPECEGLDGKKRPWVGLVRGVPHGGFLGADVVSRNVLPWPF